MVICFSDSVVCSFIVEEPQLMDCFSKPSFSFA